MERRQRIIIRQQQRCLGVGVRHFPGRRGAKHTADTRVQRGATEYVYGLCDEEVPSSVLTLHSPQNTNARAACSVLGDRAHASFKVHTLAREDRLRKDSIFETITVAQGEEGDCASEVPPRVHERVHRDGSRWRGCGVDVEQPVHWDVRMDGRLQPGHRDVRMDGKLHDCCDEER